MRCPRRIQITRVARLLAVIVAVFLTAGPVLLSPKVIRGRYLRCCARGMLAAAGVGIDIDDRRLFPGASCGLVIANHSSILDIPAIIAVMPARFVAKSDVCGSSPRGNSIAGLLGSIIGMIPVVRHSLRDLPDAVARVTAGLDSHDAVCVFPEGTTWCGRAGGIFRPAFFQSAIDASAVIHPIRIDYTINGCPTAGTAFIGDDRLLDTIARILAIRDVRVRVRLIETQLPDADRRELARRCETLVRCARDDGHFGIRDDTRRSGADTAVALAG